MNTTDATLARVGDLIVKYPWMQNDGFMTITLNVCGIEICWFARERTQVATIIREVRGKWTKNDPNDGGYDSGRARWTQLRDGVKYEINIDRREVCTRVVVGRHTELVEVPTGTTTVEREVIDYEWHCTPVLGVS